MIGMARLEADFSVSAYWPVSQPEALVAELKLQKERSWVMTTPVVRAFLVRAAFIIGKHDLKVEKIKNLK
jgi:hypothetical protein